MMKMAKLRLPKKMRKSEKMKEGDLAEESGAVGGRSESEYPRRLLFHRKESMDDMVIPSRSSSSASDSISRSSSMEFTSRAEEDIKLRALELSACYSPRKVKALRQLSRSMILDQKITSIRGRSDSGPRDSDGNSNPAEELASGKRSGSKSPKRRRRKKKASAAASVPSDDSSAVDEGLDSPSKKRKRRNSRKSKDPKERSKAIAMRSSSDEPATEAQISLSNSGGSNVAGVAAALRVHVSRQGSDSSQSESSENEVSWEVLSPGGTRRRVKKVLSSPKGIEDPPNPRRKSQPERPLTLAATPPMKPLSGDSVPPSSNFSGVSKQPSIEYNRLNIRSKKAFAQALLKGDCASKESLSNEMSTPKHLAWLFKWLRTKDALGLEAARCLAAMAYPEELVAGLQDRILSENALHPILAYVKTGEVQVHLPIKWEDIELGDRIAKGAGGLIYKAIWRRGVKRKGIEVVAKVATENMLAFNAEEHRFELGIMTMLRHKHVMSTLGGCTKGPNYFMVMPLMDLGSLESRLKTVECRSWDWIAKLRTALGICNGMCYLHENNVIHRDLKSANVLLSSSGEIEVTDFGVSREVNDSQMTKNIGTTAWIAPEVFESGTYSLSADVYSFSIVLWEIITGETPFDGVANWSIPGKVLKGERPPMPSQCPQSIKTLLTKCWDEDPATRPSFETVKAELSELYKRLRRLAV